MLKLCSKYAQTMLKICSKYAQTMLKMASQAMALPIMLKHKTKRPRRPEHYRDGEAMGLTALELLQPTLQYTYFHTI